MREYEDLVTGFADSDDSEVLVVLPVGGSVRALCAGIRWEIERQERDMHVRRKNGIVYIVKGSRPTQTPRGWYNATVEDFLASGAENLAVPDLPVKASAAVSGFRAAIKTGQHKNVRVSRLGETVYLTRVPEDGEDDQPETRGLYRTMLDDFLASGAPVWEVECDPYNTHATASGYRMVKRAHEGYESVNVRVKDGRLYLERIEW